MPALPDNVQHLVALAVPTIDALQILVVLASHPGRHHAPRDLIDQLRPAEIAEPTVHDYLALLRTHGVIAQDEEGKAVFAPASPELREAVAALLREYNQRPVTLIRTIYEIMDRKRIQSFADAFRLKGDRP
jgi:hypothetical protein